MQSKTNVRSIQSKPPWIMAHLVDPLTIFLVGKLGMDDHNGTRILEVKGRVSGKWRSTPVRLLELNGKRYVVAMYGETGWVKNLRSRGSGRLRLGRQVTEFRAVELANTEKLEAFRAYLKRWWALVNQITTVTSPDVPDEALKKDALMHPVFRLD